MPSNIIRINDFDELSWEVVDSRMDKLITHLDEVGDRIEIPPFAPLGSRNVDSLWQRFRYFVRRVFNTPILLSFSALVIALLALAVVSWR